MNGQSLIHNTLILNVTIPYLSIILGGMSVIKLLFLGILFFFWTVFSSITALAGPNMMLAIFMCLLSTPHFLTPPLLVASAKSMSDGRHRYS